MQATCLHFFGQPLDFRVHDALLPDHLRRGLVKFRIVYTSVIEHMEAAAYTFKPIASIALVKATNLLYDYKYEDRSGFFDLLKQKGDADEILIEQDGQITDTSYSNVVLQDTTGFYTPTSYLLNGTKRRSLLESGIVQERAIRVDDLDRYSNIYLINAMMDLEDKVGVPTEKILFQRSF